MRFAFGIINFYIMYALKKMASYFAFLSGITEIVDRFLAQTKEDENQKDAENERMSNLYGTSLGFEDDFLMHCVNMEQDHQDQVLSELNSFAKNVIIDKFFTIEDYEADISKDIKVTDSGKVCQVNFKAAKDLSEHEQSLCSKGNDMPEGCIDNTVKYTHTEKEELREDLKKQDIDLKIEDVLDENCWEVILQESNERDNSYQSQKNCEVNTHLMANNCDEADNSEDNQKNVPVFDLKCEKGKVTHKEQVIHEEIGIKEEFTTVEELTIPLSQAIPGHFKLQRNLITSFYLSNFSEEQGSENLTRKSSTSDDTSYDEDDIINTFVNIENNAKLIQNWENQQSAKKSCFVTINKDLQIVENIAESVLKSPDIHISGTDLAEAVKGEPLAALDMFINTELEDVKEIKQGLNILSYALTSPGLVRSMIYFFSVYYIF
jgi:hypothetical protein